MRTIRTKRARLVGLGCSLAITGLACLQTPGQTNAPRGKPKAPQAPASFERTVRPVLQRRCAGCHGGAEPVAGLNLAKATSAAAITGDPETWAKVAQRVASGEMPPGGGLPAPQRKAFAAFVQGTLNAGCRVADPGRVTVRRLNRAEYDNTVRDLIGLNLKPSVDFPSDDVGYGFDNIGDVLSTSPLLMERYLDAAERIAQAAILVPGRRTRSFEGERFVGAGNVADGARLLFTNGEAAREVTFSIGGSYRLRVRAEADQAGPDPARMEISVDGKSVGTFDVTARRGAPKAYEVPVTVEAGKHRIGVAFLNDYYDEKGPTGSQDRNLFVNRLEVVGPLEVAGPYPEAHRRIIPKEPAPGDENRVAREDLARFASRAYRRPATNEEVDALMRVYNATRKAGAGFDEAIRGGVTAVLVSPRFLFRLEADPKPGVRTLNDWELASRLSYFLWSSMPDDTLFSLARTGKLHQKPILQAQVKRMLADPKAEALADGFAAQWLQLRKLAIVNPDPKQFPGIDDALKADMATETKRFFDAVVDEDRPILDFLDGKYTFLNARLARHYGIEGVTGDEFRRVPLTGDRGGVLTQASVLLVTSNPTRTSPTKRGKWVLENILGTPPPPPPPGVSQIPDEGKRITATTLRQLMEEHRKNPACAGCHARMDPIGFGLENYDPVGRWRTKEGSFPVNASGTLPGGKTFRGPVQLKAILMGQKDAFARAFGERLMTYALGRGTVSTDACALDNVAKTAKAKGYKFSALVTAVVESDPFQKRRGETR